jgi:hypothetical protein
MPLQTSQRAAFALPCTVARGIAYLSDPATVLSALPSTQRIIERQRGSYRVMLAPIQVLGVSLRPAAEVTFATTESQVLIRSVAEEPHDLQPSEIATHVTGRFTLRPTDTGCDAHASLRVTATISARFLPAIVPRTIAQRTAEAVLTRRIKQEVQMMTRALVRGYAAWEHAE